jgi:hypothetical protein
MAPLLVGRRISLVEGEGTFVGRVLHEDPALGKLAVLLEPGKGLQNFFRRDLTSITPLDTATPEAREPIAMVTPRPATSLTSEEEMKRIFHSVRPEAAGGGPVPERMGRPGGRNSHLLNLHRVDMGRLLGRRPGPGEPGPELGRDGRGRAFRQLPAVTTTASPRRDVNGHTLPRGVVQAAVRERLWSDQDVPPAIFTPSRLYVVQEVGELYEEAVARARAAGRVGLAAEGDLQGRAAPLAWLLLATREDVFMFDVQTMGEDAWRYGLRTVLQDELLVKVTHDCRVLSDCLWHQHGVRLAGAWDLLAADTAFLSAWVLHGLLPRYTRAQAHLLRDYLGVQDADIAFPRYRRAQLAGDQAVWRTRPLPPHLELVAARGVLYLPSLHSVLRAATLQPFHRAVALLNSHVRDSDDPDAAALATETHLVPGRVRGVLPGRRQDEGGRRMLASKGFQLEGNYVHNNVGNPDPLLIYSKDSMHMATGGEATLGEGEEREPDFRAV